MRAITGLGGGMAGLLPPWIRHCRSPPIRDTAYVFPTTRTKLGERAFSVAGQTAWRPQAADVRQT